MRIRAKKMFRLAVKVREIAAPAAGNQYFLPGTLGALQHRHAPSAFASFDSAHQPRCASSKHDDVKFMNHFAFILRSAGSPCLRAFQSGTFFREDATSAAPMRLKYTYAAKDILDHFQRTRPHCRHGASSLVGTGRDDSHRLRKLVVRLSQRLVLARNSHSQTRRKVAKFHK